MRVPFRVRPRPRSLRSASADIPAVYYWIRVPGSARVSVPGVYACMRVRACWRLPPRSRARARACPSVRVAAPIVTAIAPTSHYRRVRFAAEGFSPRRGTQSRVAIPRAALSSFENNR